MRRRSRACRTVARRAAAVILVVVLVVGSPRLPGAELVVSTDFEGGSAVVEVTDSGRHDVHVRPGGDPARGWPCWWYLRLDGLADGEVATVVVRASERFARTNGRQTGTPLAREWAWPARAAVSVDGSTWLQTETGVQEGDRLTYQVTGTGGPVWVAWGPPFTSRECDALLERVRGTPHEAASVFELARSREDRPVRGVRSAPPGRRQLPAVWIQARQHAWESGSSWVASGFVEWLLGDDPDAGWLREHAEVCVVPVMDVDRVATGDGGKESDPHDHNRDWSETPFYPEIAAAQARLNAFAAEGRLAVFVDLHNPGPEDHRPFFFVPAADRLTDAARAHQARFVGCASRWLDAPLSLAAAPREIGPAYHPRWRQISQMWVSENIPADTVAVCLEIPWNTPHSTSAGYRGVGAKLGRALTDHLRSRAHGGIAIDAAPAR